MNIPIHMRTCIHNSYIKLLLVSSTFFLPSECLAIHLSVGKPCSSDPHILHQSKVVDLMSHQWFIKIPRLLHIVGLREEQVRKG